MNVHEEHRSQAAYSLASRYNWYRFIVNLRLQFSIGYTAACMPCVHVLYKLTIALEMMFKISLIPKLVTRLTQHLATTST